MMLDPDLEQRIAEILRPLLARWPGLDPEAIRESNRKQARVPEGAAVLDPVGTAPGFVVPPAEGRSVPTVVVLPGPPRELHPMWHAAVETPQLEAAVGGRRAYEQRMLRLFGIPESEIAATLREAEASIPDLAALEVTTCLRRGEIEMAVRFEPSDAPQAAWEAVSALVAERHADSLFSTDGTSVDDQVAALLRGRTVAFGESCTGGLMAARLTDRAGSSEYVAGGVVAYSNGAKASLLGVGAELIERHGAVSPQVAEALARGAAERFDADVGVGITGVAGPGGGTEDKPVGYVCFCVLLRDGRVLARDVHLPGGRVDVRDRSTTVAMHLLRRLLRGEQSPI
jgi:nicotinamide-nucleotide amidase